MGATLFLLTIAALLICKSAARTWRNIVIIHPLSPQDDSAVEASMEIDAKFLFTTTKRPSPSPTVKKYESPTINPTTSILPSEIPSLMPSAYSEHSQLPSLQPSSSPSRQLTFSPTRNPYPPNPPPTDPPSGYFNYDATIGTDYGPGYPESEQHNATHEKVVFKNNGWKRYVYPNDSYWREFGEDGFGAWKGILTPKAPERNRCWKVGKQSPIDLTPNSANCYESHQIRSLPGDYGIKNGNIEKLIENNKLRLKYGRRPCAEYELPACAEPDPPHADFPNDWGGFADVIHIDFKIPSEHTIRGERFDGEMQIFHLHPSRRRTPTISVMMRASVDGHNPVLQKALDEFQKTYNRDMYYCAVFDYSNGRKLRSTIQNDKKYNDLDEFSNETNRELEGRIWSPYDKMLLPSIYFFRYDGSLTEPPCGEWVSWFVCDTPMLISFEQLEQMKRLIFTHISPTCEKTSIHWKESVARPIQDTFGRPVSQCTDEHFFPDP